MLFRCIVIFEFKKYFIGKSYNKKYYLIKKNKFSSKFRKDRDYSFFGEFKKLGFINLVIPIDESQVLEDNVLKGA